jgi:hypothetical protein
MVNSYWTPPNSERGYKSTSQLGRKLLSDSSSCQQRPAVNVIIFENLLKMWLFSGLKKLLGDSSDRGIPKTDGQDLKTQRLNNI